MISTTPYRAAEIIYKLQCDVFLMFQAICSLIAQILR